MGIEGVSMAVMEVERPLLHLLSVTLHAASATHTAVHPLR